MTSRPRTRARSPRSTAARRIWRPLPRPPTPRRCSEARSTCGSSCWPRSSACRCRWRRTASSRWSTSFRPPSSRTFRRGWGSTPRPPGGPCRCSLWPACWWRCRSPTCPASEDTRPPTGSMPGGVFPPRELPGMLLASVAGLSLGVVLGPEAPLILLGSGLGALAVRLAARDAPDTASAVIAGAGSFAAISSLLGSPLLGAFLLLEASGLGGRHARRGAGSGTPGGRPRNAHLHRPRCHHGPRNALARHPRPPRVRQAHGCDVRLVHRRSASWRRSSDAESSRSHCSSDRTWIRAGSS